MHVFCLRYAATTAIFLYEPTLALHAALPSCLQPIRALFAQMRETLDPARGPKAHAGKVAKQNAGLLALVDQFITPNAGQLEGDDRKQLDDAVATLRKAVAGQQEWLDDTLVPNAKGDFRIGAQLYDQKLKFSLNSALSRAEIKQRSEAELQRGRDEIDRKST